MAIFIILCIHISCTYHLHFDYICTILTLIINYSWYIYHSLTFIIYLFFFLLFTFCLNIILGFVTLFIYLYLYSVRFQHALCKIPFLTTDRFTRTISTYSVRCWYYLLKETFLPGGSRDCGSPTSASRTRSRTTPTCGCGPPSVGYSVPWSALPTLGVSRTSTERPAPPVSPRTPTSTPLLFGTLRDT